MRDAEARQAAAEAGIPEGTAVDRREDWLPIPTCEIEFPILEGAPEALEEKPCESPVERSEGAAADVVASEDPGRPAGEAERARGAALPRILRQAAGSGRAGLRVLGLAALFGGLALLEVLLLTQIPVPRPLVVYVDAPRVPLMPGGGISK